MSIRNCSEDGNLFYSSLGRDRSGGAIYNEGALTVRNCFFIGNVALGGPGPGGYCQGCVGPGGIGYGGAFFNSGLLVVSNCVFQANRAAGGRGGGVSGGGRGGVGLGGAIYNTGRLLIFCTTFFGNSASGGDGGYVSPYYSGYSGGSGGLGEGGGIWNSGSVSLMSSTFFSNFSNSVSGGSGTPGVQGNFGYAGGGGRGGSAHAGGLHNWNGLVSMTNNTIVSNYVTGGSGGTGGDRSPGYAGGDGGTGGDALGGGIWNSGGTLTSEGSTITGNRASGGSGGGGGRGGAAGLAGSDAGAGFFDDSHNSWLHNTIVAANSVLGVFGSIRSQGHNLIGNTNESSGWLGSDLTGSATPLDPKLGPLQNNGGTTFTMAPLAGSPAIDQGSSGGVSNDTRGQPRPYDNPDIPNAINGDGSDIGACELQPILILIVPATADERDSTLRGAGEVRLPWALSTNLIVELGSSDLTEVTVPSDIIIPAGQTNARFNLTIVDDMELDGPQIVSISASARSPGFEIGRGAITVLDNETGTLTVLLPPSATEGQGTVQGSVSVDPVPTANFLVSLSSSNPAAIQVPASLLLTAGQSSAVFTATVVDDTMIDGPQTALITAHFPNWNDGQASITVLDNEDLALRVALPAALSEAAGVLTNAGQVRLSGTLPTNLVVSLVSSLPSRLTVPATVIIPHGQLSAAFNLSVMNNSNPDDDQWLLVTVTAQDFETGSASLFIVDDDVPRIVTNTNNAGPGSIRQAILDVNAGGPNQWQILITNLSGTIVLSNSLPAIAANTSIIGPGANRLTISGNNGSSIFTYNAGRTNQLSGLTIANGVGGSGGGILNAGTLNVESCVLSNNQAFEEGGGIYNSGDLTLLNSTIVSNQVFGAEGGLLIDDCSQCATVNLKGKPGRGGGLFTCCGTINIINCTFYGNKASGGRGGACRRSFDGITCTFGQAGDSQGGGLLAASGVITVLNSTFSANQVIRNFGEPPGPRLLGGGICNEGGNLEIRNTLVAGNRITDGYYYPGSSSVQGPNIQGTFNSDGHNLIEMTNDSSGWIASDLKGSYDTPLDPKLGLLQANGGPTWTMALLPGSRAIDAGDDTLLNLPFALTNDQRGLPRRSGLHVDIGAFELQLATTPFYFTSQVVLGNGQFQMIVTNISGASLTILAATNISLPLSNWTVLGAMTEISSGQFEFTDQQATNVSQRFYRLRSP